MSAASGDKCCSDDSMGVMKLSKLIRSGVMEKFRPFLRREHSCSVISSFVRLTTHRSVETV